MTQPKRISLFVLAAIACFSVAATDGDAPSAKQRLLAMTAEEKAQLTAKQERFESLDLAEQKRIRELHEQLTTHPQQERLQAVMNAYTRWVGELSPSQRAELAGMNSDERLSAIERMKQQQTAQQLAELTPESLAPEDIRALLAFANDYIRNHRDELMAEIPEPMKQRLANVPPEFKSRAILYAMQRDKNFNAPPPTPEEIERLQARLSPEASRLLVQAKTPQAKKQLVNRWLQASIYARARADISERDMQRFIARLSPKQREELEALPREEMQRKLRAIYQSQAIRPNWRNDGRRPGEHGRDGDRPRPPFERPGDRPGGDRPGDRPREEGDRPTDRPDNRPDGKRPAPRPPQRGG